MQPVPMKPRAIPVRSRQHDRLQFANMMRGIQTSQKEIVEHTSTARGEIPIISVSPSSPVLGFCTTFVTGRTGEDEKEATCWRNGNRDMERGPVILYREVVGVILVVCRQVATSPTEDAEMRKAGRDVEKRRACCCDSRRAAVDDRSDLVILKGVCSSFSAEEWRSEVG